MSNSDKATLTSPPPSPSPSPPETAAKAGAIEAKQIDENTQAQAQKVLNDPVIKKILSRVDRAGLNPSKMVNQITMMAPAGYSVTKNLLCGCVQSDNFVSHKGEILGYALKSNENSKWHMSVLDKRSLY